MSHGAVRGGNVDERDLPRQGRPARLPVPRRAAARDGEFRIAAQGRGRDLRLRAGCAGTAPQSARAPWPRAHRSRRAGLRPLDARDPQRAGASSATSSWSGVAGRHPRTSASHAGARARGDARRAARRHAALRQHHAGRRLDRQGARAAPARPAPAELKLALDMPLVAPRQTTVKGSLALAGNDVRISARHAAARPRPRAASTSRSRASRSSARARACSAATPASKAAHAGRRQHPALQRPGHGHRRRPAPARPSSAGRAPRRRRSAARRATASTLGFVARPARRSTSTSNLVGLGDRPAGAARQGGRRRRCRCATRPASSANRRPPRRSALRDSAAASTSAASCRRSTCASSAATTARVLRGGDRRARRRRRRRRAAWRRTSTLQRLDVDAWEAALGKRPARGSGAPAPRRRPAARDRRGAAAFDGVGGDGYVPDAIALRAQELAVGRARLTTSSPAHLAERRALARQHRRRRAQRLCRIPAVAARRRRAAPAACYARLARLSAAEERRRAASSAARRAAGDAMPALDIVVDDFELRGKSSAGVEIEATNRARERPRRRARVAADASSTSPCPRRSSPPPATGRRRAGAARGARRGARR